jgi:hypothetical protein
LKRSARSSVCSLEEIHEKENGLVVSLLLSSCNGVQPREIKLQKKNKKRKKKNRFKSRVIAAANAHSGLRQTRQKD